MSYHLTRSRRRPRSMGDIGLPPLPDLPPVPPAPPDPSDSGKTWFEEFTEPIAKIFGTPTPTPAVKPPAIKPLPMTVPLPARPGMSTTTKLMIAGGAVALVALVTR